MFGSALTRLALVCQFGLFLFQILWHSKLSPTGQQPWLFVLVALLPFFIAAWWMRRDSWKALVLLNYLGLLYFCHGVMVGMSKHPFARLGWMEASLAVLSIVLLTAQVMIEKKRRGQSKPIA